MMSIISSLAKVLLIGTFFSKCSRAKSTLSEMEPPLIWTSTMWAFFCLLLKIACWVWKIPLTTWQYFLIWAISFSISFLPVSSFHLRQALVKAFFLDLDLYFGEEQTHKKNKTWDSSRPSQKKAQIRRWGRAERPKRNPSCMLQKPLQEVKKKGQERRPKPKVSSIPKHKFGMIGNQMLALLREKRVGAKIIF